MLESIKGRLLVYLEQEETDSILELALEYGFDAEWLVLSSQKEKEKARGTPGLLLIRRLFSLLNNFISVQSTREPPPP